MKKSFRKKLKIILYFGTIIPIVCFVLMFMYKFFMINLEAEKLLFMKEFENFEENLVQTMNKKNQLVNTSLSFLQDDNLFTSDIDRQKYLNGLIAKSDAIHYAYIDEKTIATFNSSQIPNEELFVEKNYIYISGQDRARLILAFDMKMLSHDIEKYLGESYDYNLSFGETDVINHVDEVFQIDYLEWDFFDKHIKLEKNIDGSNMVLSLHRDISREIDALITMGWLFLSLLGVYIVIMIYVIFLSSKSLLKPLNKLINTVSTIAEDNIAIDRFKLMDDEYAEIYESFNEMTKSVSNNIDMLTIQSSKIEESNQNMIDMNEQLNESLENLERSIKKLEILEKQSKILVDHIKDLMWVIDSKGRIIYINNVVSDKLGYSVDELSGIKLENIIYRDYKNEEAYQEIFYDDCEDLELRFVTHNLEHEEIFSCSTKRIMQHGKLIKIQGVCRDITEERFIESQMIQKNIISETLNEISEILTRPEKLEFLLKHIVIRIERLLNPLICTIRMVDEKGKLELKAGIGECYGLVQEKYLDIDKDISGRAIKEGKIIIISDKNESDYDNYDEVYSIVERSKELVFLPLEYDGTTIGVMSIGLRESLPESDLKILKVFTNQASAAIEKARMYEEIENNYLNIIKALASTVEAKDAYTENHSIRVSQYSRMIAEEMGLSEEEVGYIDIAGLLHDIGKIGISDLILTKSGNLTKEEFAQIKKHPLNGGRIVSEMKLHPYIIEGVLLHHKRFDLKGYPNIDIDSLPLSARIIGVADAFDAMTSNRSYQKAKTYREALEELKKCSGKQFCPEIVKIMESVVIRIERLAS